MSFLAEDNNFMWINAGDQHTMNILSLIPAPSSLSSCLCQRCFLLMHSKGLFWDLSHLFSLCVCNRHNPSTSYHTQKKKNPLIWHNLKCLGGKTWSLFFFRNQLSVKVSRTLVFFLFFFFFTSIWIVPPRTVKCITLKTSLVSDID